MIQGKNLTSYEDFLAIKPGDILACEFHRDVYPKKIRFGVFTVFLNKKQPSNEIILQKKDNIFFNYQMFVEGESNLKTAILLTSEPDQNILT